MSGDSRAPMRTTRAMVEAMLTEVIPGVCATGTCGGGLGGFQPQNEERRKSKGRGMGKRIGLFGKS